MSQNNQLDTMDCVCLEMPVSIMSHQLFNQLRENKPRQLYMKQNSWQLQMLQQLAIRDYYNNNNNNINNINNHNNSFFHQ